MAKIHDFLTVVLIRTRPTSQISGITFFSSSLVLTGPVQTYFNLWVLMSILLSCMLPQEIENFNFNQITLFELFWVIESHSNVWLTRLIFEEQSSHDISTPVKSPPNGAPMKKLQKINFFPHFNPFLLIFTDFPPTWRLFLLSNILWLDSTSKISEKHSI